MNDITLSFPFLGSLSLGQFVVAIAAIYLSLPLLPGLASGLGSLLLAWLKRGPSISLPTPTPQAAGDVPPEVAAALAALQTLALWAVRYGSAQLLAKVVELFGELQTHTQTKEPSK